MHSPGSPGVETFVINLPRDVERMDAIRSNLDAIGLPFRVQRGIDTATMGPADFDAIRMKALDPSAPPMTQGTVGCALSHQAVYRTMIEEQIDHALILEDDAVVDRRLTTALPHIVDHLGDDRIVLLFYHFALTGPFEVSAQDPIQLTGDIRMYAPIRKNIHGAVAYVISRAVADRLLEANTPIRFAADVWSQYFNRGGFDSLRVVSPHLVDISGVPSTRAMSATAAPARSLRRPLRQMTSRIPVVQRGREDRDRREWERKRTPVVVEERSSYA